MQLTTQHLKWIALVTMVLDHLAFFFPSIFPFWFHFVGRIAAPLFLWIIVVNAERSRNPLGMVSKLLLWGLGMMAGNAILTAIATTWLGSTDTPLYGFGIFLSLAVTVGLAISWKTITSKSEPLIAKVVAWTAIPLLIMSGLLTEGSYAILSLAIVFIVARTKPWLIVVGMSSISLFLIAEGVQFGLSPLEYYQWMSIAALPLLLLHHTARDRKPSRASTLWYYLFYPVHIWVLYLVSLLIQR